MSVAVNLDYHVEIEKHFYWRRSGSLGGAIRYDHVVISQRAILVHANEIRAKYQKSAIIERELSMQPA
jgi:hypothetical protein